jgi:hypothetical protein
VEILTWKSAGRRGSTFCMSVSACYISVELTCKSLIDNIIISWYSTYYEKIFLIKLWGSKYRTIKIDADVIVV